MWRIMTIVAITVIVAVALIWLLSQPESSAPIDIKVTTIQLSQQQLGEGIERFAKYARAELKEKARIRTYPAAQLYTGQEEVQAIMKGQNQIAFIPGSNLDMVEPAMQMLSLPYLFPNTEITFEILDGQIGGKLWELVEKKGITFLGAVGSGTNVVFNSKHPVVAVEDFTGLKLRSYGPMGASCLQALGAMSVVTASEETYTALQQRVIDGGITPISVFIVRRYYEVANYITDPHMLNSSTGFLIASDQWWKELPVEVRASLTKAAERTTSEMRREMIEQEALFFKEAAEKGMQIHIQTPAEEAEWKKALQPVYEEFSPIIGADLVKETQETVERMFREKD